ncbi:MAG TPA: hypothetical protein VGL22_00135 [Terracidiphilus sp.]
MSPTPPIDATLLAELEAVYASYLSLHPETGLGGKLLYAGQLDQTGSRLVRAANIAGAASLSAAPDSALQRSAIRDGVVDFLVTSVDEALRILKNEIRKSNAVSVGVSCSPPQLVREMRDRGVLPDLLPANLAAELPDLIAQGAQPIASATPGNRLFTYPSPAPDLDRRALELIPESDHAARRWLRLSHRYLGPAARRIRSVPADAAIAAALTKP